ncbi:hypothetical protein PI124_g14397 [Phytophthora idaei]|nr:hypothetical protein PI125_g12211 [Phytophthora idaei]KAG3150807.1 hypothetical protein PI126_g11297 [Phytophthora idaei]KAG3240714.1 hypothetical protein PI124_g14397 [Phytophthora idaei]
MDYGLHFDGGVNDLREEPKVTIDNTPDALSFAVVSELKNALLDGLRDMVKDIGINPSSTQETVHEEHTNDQVATVCDDDTDMTHLVSEFPDAKSWRDYVKEYGLPNAASHQYRTSVGMLSHERKVQRSRLSRMKIIVESIRAEFGDDLDLFERTFAGRIRGELTVNKILAEIRKRNDENLRRP